MKPKKVFKKVYKLIKNSQKRKNKTVIVTQPPPGYNIGEPYGPPPYPPYPQPPPYQSSYTY